MKDNLLNWCITNCRDHVERGLMLEVAFIEAELIVHTDVFMIHVKVSWLHEDSVQCFTDLGLNIVDVVARLNVESHAVACESLNEDLAKLNLESSVMESRCRKTINRQSIGNQSIGEQSDLINQIK